MSKNSEKKKWIILIIGTVMLLFAGLIYAWSIFRIPLEAIFVSWTGSDLTTIFVVSMICFCLGNFFSGLLVKKIPQRFVILIAAVMLFCGFFVISRLNVNQPDGSLANMIVFYGAFCGTGVVLIYNAVITVVTTWFRDKAGLAAGTMMMGFGLGSLILGAVVNTMLQTLGVFKVFFILACVILIVMVAGSFAMHRKNEDMQARNIKANKESNGREYNTRQMLKTPVFWVYFLWVVLVASVGYMVLNSAALIMVAYGAPAILGMVVSATNGGARFVFGGLLDKIGFSKTMLIGSLLMLVASIFLLTGAVFASVGVLVIGMLLKGLGGGGSAPTNSAVILTLFGSKHYPVNFSIILFTIIPAAILGPSISTALLEKTPGDYTTTFIAMIVFIIAIIIVNLIFNKMAARFEEKSSITSK